jgi:TatD DNase family protein
VIDVHCHLTFEAFDSDREEIICDLSKRLKAVIVSSTDVEDAERVLKLCAEHPSFLYATLGLHPVYAPDMDDQRLESYLRFIRDRRSKIVGIGEVGLDYHWVKEEAKRERMREVFSRFLELAQELDLPIVLHLRDAIDSGLRMVIDSGVKKVLFHCFTGKKKQAQEITSYGCYISLAPNILKSKDLKRAARTLSLERVLTETDSPYLDPEGGRNTPHNVSLVIQRVAEVQGLTFEEVDHMTTQNAQVLFNLGEGHPYF